MRAPYPHKKMCRPSPVRTVRPLAIGELKHRQRLQRLLLLLALTIGLVVALLLSRYVFQHLSFWLFVSRAGATGLAVALSYYQLASRLPLNTSTLLALLVH